MEKEEYQRDLFGYEKPRKRIFNFSGMFRKSDFEGTLSVTISLDRIVFISIGILMVMVVVFALGVEKGRSVVRMRERGVSISSTIALKPATESKQDQKPGQKPAAISAAALPPSKQAATQTAAPAGQTASLPQDNSKPYTIIAATYGRKENAAQEASRLKKEGFDAYVASSEPYYVVCVGSFADKDSGQSRKALNKIRQAYKDAYFKLK